MLLAGHSNSEKHLSPNSATSENEILVRHNTSTRILTTHGFNLLDYVLRLNNLDCSDDFSCVCVEF